MAESNRTTPAKYVPVLCPTCGTPESILNGAWMAHARLRAGLTLREFAQRLGVSAAYICDIEHNRRNGSAGIRAAYEAL